MREGVGESDVFHRGKSFVISSQVRGKTVATA